MRYIDLRNARSAEHYEEVEKLLKQGYKYTFSSFGNPHFFNEDKKEEVCILSNIIEQSGYFSI